mmetsp:Transcript_86367/g.268311  ORF Transcript_86367/g.268311 Transcript_86367/m.268311 type:complete len:454 (-) Transcript_86367:25-1386(-)
MDGSSDFVESEAVQGADNEGKPEEASGEELAAAPESQEEADAPRAEPAEEQAEPPKAESAKAAETKPEEAKPRTDGERPEWWPKTQSMDVLNHILWKVMPQMQGQPCLELLPSPGFFHASKPEFWEVYCMPFLPLPSLGANGAPQHGRAELEGSIGKDLLDWLFDEESDDPIVYVAFGTIVSQFNSRALVERLVEALANAPWRVLLVLPDSTRALLPKDGDDNLWRWTVLGAEVAKSVLEKGGQVREGDIFEEEQLAQLGKAIPKLRTRAAVAELGLIVESRAHTSALQPSRFRVESFVPQVHVLRCERVRVFVSHNGANSTLESMACGVPMLCTPFYLDQYDWANTVRQNLRAGIQVDKILTDAAALRGAVRELLEEPAYRRNAQAVAKRIAAQSALLARALGPAMEPKASMGPGLSVLGALCVSHVKRQDIWPSIEAALQAPSPPPAAAVR